MTQVDWDESDPDDYPGEFYDDEGDDEGDDEDLESDTMTCPTCGQDVYEDAEQCPACGSYITHRHTVAPVWRWTAGFLLLFLAWIVWLAIRHMP